MADEFDSWLNSTSKPKAAAAPAPAALGWGFSASSLLGGTGASSLLGGTGASSLLSAVDTLRSQALDAADSLKDTIQTQAPVVANGLTSVTSVAGAVAGQLQQTVESQMSQFADEQARFCTEDAKRAEMQQYKDIVHTMGQTIGVPTSELDEHGVSLWADAPEPLRAAFEEAIRKLAQAESSFLSEAQLPPAKHDPSDAATEAELQVLLKMARGALVRDEQLRQMRFKLVPTRVKEAPFWRHYMLRVLRERRLFGLPVLKPSADDAPPAAPATGAPATGAPNAAQPPSTAAADEFETVDLLHQAEAEADALLLAASTPSARSADATLHAATASLSDTFASAAAAATTPSLTAAAATAPPHRRDGDAPTPATSQRSAAPSLLSSPPTTAPDAGTPATIAYVAGGAVGTGVAPPAAPPSVVVADAVAPATPASSAASATPATAMPPAIATTPSAAAAAATVVAAAANVAAAAAAAEAALATPAATPTPVAATTPAVPDTVSPAPAPAEALTAEELEARIARELELGDGEDGDSGELIDAVEDFDNVLGDL